ILRAKRHRIHAANFPLSSCVPFRYLSNPKKLPVGQKRKRMGLPEVAACSFRVSPASARLEHAEHAVFSPRGTATAAGDDGFLSAACPRNAQTFADSGFETSR